MKRRSLIGAAMLGASGWAAAQASAWPTRSINLIVPFPPGGLADARRMAEVVKRIGKVE